MNTERNNRPLFFVGCGFLLLLLVGAALLVFLVVPNLLFRVAENGPEPPAVSGQSPPQEAIPTLTLPPEEATVPFTPTVASGEASATAQFVPAQPDLLSALFEQTNPGVVNVQVFLEEALGGQGAGSGFILDEQGHIVTNNHVVAGASQVIVVFYDGTEAAAEIVGTDDDSDLAVIRVQQLAEGAHPLPLGDSDQTAVGEWVIAIGNPFGLGSSMTVGIVSALGRTIASGITPFSIPQAIQTDAAINPGNSGGPLLNLEGEVIGVNAQIATGGASRGNVGVGFAIPSNVVRLVAPALIEAGAYDWPWLGVSGGSVNLIVMEANNLETQQGAYIHQVIPGGPADEAGLQGTTGVANVNGVEAPVGGDVVVAVDGQPVQTFDDMLARIAFMNPGDTVTLTILRDGQQREVDVTLQARPSEFASP
ncbi:MAG: trypsin-like peptidase domain-containing protein [Chloroflexi bacterium]|nr:trypsin-like peptidase domain-containing protein [Chloroflexota bacterium]MCI0574950.1 trypsin-like peptidase domain-containing protein [Chloroflexota bacterium]MCI0645860.1 trypsin-like peptidase domain-containing protein [Chloroflexota bacterium]MCI0725715.1 trypsin-like peptidase domain-containing protein [Chloroflexota bacterium]